MIEIKNLSKYYSNSGVTTLGLHNVNLSFHQGEIVGIVGESGSGKSTLLNLISGMDSYDDGEIYFNGEETSYFDQKDRDEFRKKNVAFINQNYNIVDSYSVLDNVTLPLILNGMSEKEAKVRAKELIEKVHLTHRLHSKGSKLSGGEKQRCVIARALAKDTPILVCDEPTGNLDSKTGEEIIQLLKEVSAGKLVLLVTHNEEQANPILTRKLRIHDGEVVEDVNMGNSSSVDEEAAKKPEMKKNKRFRFSMAWKNIIGTPKKNIFTTIVFTVFSFLLIYLYLLASQSGASASYSSSSNFLNLTHERMIVYREDHTPLDASKLSSIAGDKYQNAFYEDSYVIMSDTDKSIRSSAIMSYHLPLNSRISQTEPTINPALNNVTLVVGENYGKYYSVGTDKCLYKELISVSISNLELGTIHISKIAICDEVDIIPIIVFEDGVDRSFLDNVFEDSYTISSIDQNDGESFTLDNSNISIVASGKTDNDAAKKKYNTLVYKGKNNIAKPECINATIGGMYSVKFTDFDYEVIETDSSTDVFEFYCVEPVMPEECYELTIYAKNVDSAKKIIKKAGYQYIIPSQAKSKNAFARSVARIITIILYILISLLGLLLTLAVYGILSKVYMTKAKDFTIFRSLGVLKEDLRSVVSLEISFFAFVSTILSIIIVLILGLTIPYFKTLLATSTPWAYIFFFIIMQLLGLIISRRFNKRIFKLTITDSLKEERR